MNFLEADVAIKVDDSRLPQQLAKARSAVTRTVSKIKLAFGKMATSFKAAFDKIVRYAKYGAIAVIGALTLMTRAAMKQEQAYAKLATVLKSTGYAAGLSRKELIAHSEALQKVTIYGDETIQSMQALLLTFKSIRGEVFMRTTEAILDLSKAMGQDLQQSVIQIGKAINDPVLGMTALRRVGIQFTKNQEEMIKTLVEAGDLFEAQNIILMELESQFGGMSRIVDTASGKWDQMKNALGDVAEIIGNALLPGVKDSLTAIKEWAERNQERIGRWAEISVAYIAYVKDMLISFIQFLWVDWKAGLKFAADVGIKVWEVFAEKMKNLFRKLGEDLANIITGEWPKSIWEWGKEKVIPPPAGVYQKLDEQKLAERFKRTFGIPKLEPTTILAEPIITEVDKVKKAVESIVPPELQIKFDVAGEKLKATLESIGAAAEEIEKPMEQALVMPIEQAAEAAEKLPIRLKKVYQDIASAMARSWANAIDEMMFEGKRFGDAMKDMFRSLLRMIAQIIMYQVVAEPIAQRIIEAIPGAAVGAAVGGGGGGAPATATTTAFTSPHGGPALQHGGTVERTGWAKVHRGETFSGVGKGGGGLTVNVNNDNLGVEIDVSEADMYILGDQRIVDVFVTRAGTDGSLRKAIKSAAK